MKYFHLFAKGTVYRCTEKCIKKLIKCLIRRQTKQQLSTRTIEVIFVKSLSKLQEKKKILFTGQPWIQLMQHAELPACLCRRGAPASWSFLWPSYGLILRWGISFPPARAGMAVTLLAMWILSLIGWPKMCMLRIINIIKVVVTVEHL